MSAIGKGVTTIFAAFSLAGMAFAQDAQSETRLGEEGFESPPATLEQMDWLVGQWSGEGIGGAPAMESWLPPTGPTMVGTFVQESDGGIIMFTEHLYLMEEEGSLVLRLKHFNADLTSWEEKDEMLTFRLVAMEPCAAYFHALTLRCADPEKPGEGLIAAVRMSSGNELIFNFEAMARNEATTNPCADAVTTVEMTSCAARLLNAAERIRKEYYDAAAERFADDADTISLLTRSRDDFESYRDKECRAYRRRYEGGSIQNTFFLQCLTRLTEERTHAIWRHWLTFMNENDEPLRPEPRLTR